MTTALSARLSAAIIGILFIVPGVIKTVDVNKGLQKHMLSQYRNFSTVFPLAVFGLKPGARAYMEAAGVLEIGAGLLLIGGLPLARRVACLLLMGLMLLITQSYLRLGDTASLIVPAGYFGLLCWTFMCMRKADDGAQSVSASGGKNVLVNGSGDSRPIKQPPQEQIEEDDADEEEDEEEEVVQTPPPRYQRSSARARHVQKDK